MAATSAQTIAALLDILKRKSLVFTVTAGRTGTALLARLFETLPEVSAGHEAEPNFVLAMRRSQEDPELAKLFLLLRKLPAMAAVGRETIVETSHLACKGFLEPMVALGLRPALILLRREPRSIALSYLAKQTVPGRSTLGWSYLLYPHDPGVLPLTPHPSVYSDYQLCFWYALEMERRQWLYPRLFAGLGMAVADVAAPDLHDPRRWFGLLAELTITPADPGEALRRHAAIVRQDWNRGGPQPSFAIDFEREEARVWDSVAATFPHLQAIVAARAAEGTPAGRVST